MSLTIYGFDASTYVRSARMLLAEKGADYELVPVNVLTGETGEAEHLARNPFGKVPVMDHGDLRLYETSAICRYLNDALPGKSLVPGELGDRARMDMAMGIYDNAAYGALLGLAAQHLFPDFVGGKNEEVRQDCMAKSRLALGEIMKLRGSGPWIAGADLSLADLFLAPVCFYVDMTEDKGAAFDIPGMGDWWAAAQALESYQMTMPNLG